MKKQLQFFWILLCITSITANAQVPGYVPSQGLQGWWGFTGNPNDLSANGNDLTNNGAVLTTDRYGVANSAYSFDGISQYLTNTNPSFSFGSTDEFTVSFWLKKTSVSYGVAVMNSSSVNTNFIWLVQTSTTGDIQFGTNKQGSSWTWTPTSYSINQWDHFIATYNNTSMSFYKNGTLVSSATFPHTGSIKSTLPLWVGRGHAGNYINGEIDDLGIWNRALTLAEIADLYNGCNIQVLQQPLDVATTETSNASFTVDVNATGYTFQWQKHDGINYQDLGNGGQFSGTTTDSLVVSNVTLSNDGDKYRCVITEVGACSDTSDVAVLNICGNVDLQPLDQTVVSGTPATFVTSSTDANATFQWQIESGTNFINLSNGVLFSGVKTGSLTVLSPTILSNNEKYRCLISSNVCTDTTSIATLFVGPVGLDENRVKALKLYPNPANQVLVFSVPGLESAIDYAVFNQSGALVLDGKTTGEETKLNISSLSEGVYILRISNKWSQRFSVLR